MLHEPIIVIRELEVFDLGIYVNSARLVHFNRKLNSTDVLGALTDLFTLRGPLEYIRSDYRPEFIAQNVCDLIAAVGAKTAHIELG